MPPLSPKDRASLCLFTFEGRRCRTPRTGRHPHFCFYHAQKEARAQAAEKLGKDLAYFFSGDYLSACDLSTALSRLIPAVIRGDIKPKLARTVAYMVQTLRELFPSRPSSTPPQHTPNPGQPPQTATPTPSTSTPTAASS